jgi:hypothetical protein
MSDIFVPRIGQSSLRRNNNPMSQQGMQARSATNHVLGAYQQNNLVGSVIVETRLAMTVTTAATTATDVLNLSVAGNGLPMILTVTGSASCSLAGGISGGIWDTANRGGTQLASFFGAIPANGNNIPLHIETVTIPAFAGNKTFHFNILSQAGTASLYGDNSVVVGAIMRAVVV